MSKPPKHESFLRDLRATCAKSIALVDGEIDYQRGNELNAAKHGRTNDQIIAARNIGYPTGSRDAFKFVLDLVDAELGVLPPVEAEIPSSAAQMQIDEEAVEAAYARHEAGKPYPKENDF